MLSDLFGIQARSGCFCAGPYLHRLYEIDDRFSARMHAEVARGQMGAKLAFTRLTFNYFISETVFAYILDAVHLIAEHGWKLLPLYRFDPDSGLWRHRAGVPDPPTSLSTALQDGPRRFATAPESVLPGQLEAARRVIRSVQAHPPARPLHDPELSDEFERIRWFPLPGEALEQLRSTRHALAARGGRPTAASCEPSSHPARTPTQRSRGITWNLASPQTTAGRVPLSSTRTRCAPPPA